MEQVRASDDDAVARATLALDAGHLAVVPTDTLYGLAADALDEDACLAVFRAKERPPDQPLPVCVADLEDARHVAHVTPLARRLAERFLPGAVTLVLPARDTVPDVVTAAGPTVAVRVPANAFARALAAHFGPFTVTSANVHKRPPARTIDEAVAQLGDRVALYVDDGPLPGTASTMVDATGASVKVIREGAVAASTFEGF
ncbi:MAG TPA: L-threonylcarbamoyladenylate synthase [Candidatus Thermoplasmatota archaeon]|nr:L-threonylcarbamoyladenylate synthase [Candidatus Thermoplasmatota archaeon]